MHFGYAAVHRSIVSNRNSHNARGCAGVMVMCLSLLQSKTTPHMLSNHLAYRSPLAHTSINNDLHAPGKGGPAVAIGS